MHKKVFDNFGNQSFFSTNHTNFDFDNEFDFDFESNSELFDSAFDRRNLNNQRNMAGEINVSTCQRLANILGGVVVTSTPACVVQRNRNINATILGRRTQSALSLPFALSFENNINA